MKVTIERRTDGFGAQYQNEIFCLLYAEAHGYQYVHIPFQEMEHNIWNEEFFLEKAEETVNLLQVYAGNHIDTTILSTDDFYDEVEQSIDKYTSGDAMKKIKELYWENKEKDYFKNDRFNIAVHVRRFNTRDCRVTGTDTPDEYYLYIINRLREKYFIHNPLFHIYSQNKVEDFEKYVNNDTVLHIDENVFDSFNAMVAADVLVTSASSFSYTAALLSEGEVYYHLFWHKPKKDWKVLFDFDKLRSEKRKVDLLLCTMKIALSCDYIIDQRFDDTHEITKLPVIEEEYLLRLKDGGRLFIGGTNIEIFVDRIVKILKSKKIKLEIIISNIEPHCDEESVMKLLPYAYNIYVSNNIIDHPRIHAIPIGLRDPVQVHATHKNFTHDFMREEMRHQLDKDFLCLLCFRLEDSSSQNRKDCYKVLSEKSFVTNLNILKFEEENPIQQCGHVPINIHYNYIHKSKYALCPTGYGFDTHKFYECLYLKTIPIVIKTNTPFDKLYKTFPCLLLDSWDDLTEELMNENYDRLYNEIVNFETNNLIKVLAWQ